MELDCDWCDKSVSQEQADFTFMNYHEILCPECAAYVSKRQIVMNKNPFF